MKRVTLYNYGCCLFFLLCLMVLRTESFSCQRDIHLTGESNKMVNWWLIIKVRGFSDYYLYMDSLSQEEEFKTGYYLRSSKSALGSTMSPYTGKNINEGKKSYINYNNQMVVFDEKSPFKTKKDDDQEYYNEGAHEKGFIAFNRGTNENDWKGFFLQHTLPRMMNYRKDGIHTYLNEPIAFSGPANFFKDKRDNLYFTYYGWENPFFVRNLMPYYPQGTKLLQKIGNIENEEKEFIVSSVKLDTPSDQERLNKKKEVLLMKAVGGTLGYLNMNPFSLIYTTYVKPSQHLLCISIENKASFKDLIGQLALTSNKGIVSSLYREHQGNTKAFHDFRNHLYLSGDTSGNPTSYATRAEGFHKKDIEVEFETIKNKFYTAVNVAGPNNKKDIWKNLIEDTNTNQPSLAAGHKMSISTWVTKQGGAWWRTAPYNTRVSEHKLQINPQFGDGSVFTWLSNSNQEHSKIGFTEKSDHPNWNFCASGGNLYAQEKASMKSSLIICFASKNLNNALTKLKGGDKYIVAADVDDVDGEEDEDKEIENVKPIPEDEIVDKTKDFIQKIQTKASTLAKEVKMLPPKQVTRRTDRIASVTKKVARQLGPQPQTFRDVTFKVTKQNLPVYSFFPNTDLDEEETNQSVWELIEDLIPPKVKLHFSLEIKD
ncbi:hypothetical protein CYY_004736 [Polysphondylium violaceum]|uniref:Uncharacterized protein n=1 Tax=Polysphondylium violaceum TaxID=133409 RepID=A0A8J4V7G7_9MYCE|nr:hypothetical protein CYY_004736 [Polysphondylium violaceum]